MKEFTGACRYCGQVAAPGRFASQEAADDYATDHCDCTQAKYEANVRKCINEAEANVDALFGEDCKEFGFEPMPEDIIEELKRIVRLIAQMKIASTRMQLSRGGSAGVTVNAKGKIKVTRSKSVGYSLETEG